MANTVAQREESEPGGRLWGAHVKRLSLHVAAAVALIPASVTGPLESQDAVYQTLTVTGTLVDEAGPAAGVEVALRLYRSEWERDVAHLTGAGALPEAVDRVRAGPDGSFSLVAPAAGPWRLEFALPAPAGERRTVSAPLHLPLLPLVAPVVPDPIEVPARHPLDVRVSDPDGRLLEGALVLVGPVVERRGRHSHTARPQRTRLNPRFGLAVARTDVDGVARFVLPAAEANAVVSAAGFALRVARVRSGNNVLQLARAVPTVFRVRDSRGRRAPRVVVRGRGPVEVPLALTDSDGEAAVSVSAKQPLALEFEGNGGESAQTGPRSWSQGGSSGEEQVVDVQLQEAAAIQGRLVDAESGSPVSGAAIWSRSDPGRSALSDSLGVFTLSVAADQGDRLVAAAAGFVSANAAIDAAQLRTSSDLAIVVEPAVPLNGAVVDNMGQAVGGAEVRAEPTGAWRAPHSSAGGLKRTISAPDGSFWISYAHYGVAYRLIVEAAGYASAAENLPRFRRDRMVKPVQVALSRGRQPWGTVVDQDGAPVTAAEVRLFRPSPEPSSTELARIPLMEEPAAMTASVAHGNFVLRSVALGEYRVRISYPEYAELRETKIDVPPGTGQYDLGVFALSRGEQIRGIVVDPKGRPVAGAEVSSSQPHHDVTSQVRTAITDEQGRFCLTGLLPVSASLTATAGEYPPTVESVSPGTGEIVRMELVEGAVLAGRVLDLAGKTVGGVEVVLHPLRGRSSRPSSVLSGRSLFRVETASDGSFRFGNLHPSSWFVRARDEAGRTAIGRVELSRGEVRELEFRLKTTIRLVILVGKRLGEPVANAYVRVNPESPNWPPAFGRTDASGRVELQTGFGEARIDVSHPELSAWSREIVLGSGRNEVHVQLDPAGETVRSIDGYR